MEDCIQLKAIDTCIYDSCYHSRVLFLWSPFSMCYRVLSPSEFFFYESLLHRVPFNVLSETCANIFINCTESLHSENQINNHVQPHLRHCCLQFHGPSSWVRFPWTEKVRNRRKPATQIGAQCGAHGSKMPHASCITTHYMVDAMSIPWPCFHTAPIPVTIQWLTIWPWANKTCHAFTKMIIVTGPFWASGQLHNLCSSCGIMSEPYIQVSWQLSRNCRRQLCPLQRDIGWALLYWSRQGG